MFKRMDRMVQIVLAGIVLATLLPAKGEAQGLVQTLSNAAVFVLFLLYGLKLARRDVLAGLTNMRLLGPLTLFVFGVMAMAGWLVWREAAGWLPPALALGFLYLGCLPSTVQSATVYTSIAGGNVASSVVAAALLNIVGVFVSAPLFSLLAGMGGGGVAGSSFVKVAALMLLPFVIGQAAQGWFGRLVREHKSAVSFLERGTIGLAVYSAFSGAVNDGIWSRVDLTGWAGLVLGCLVLLIVGYGGAWLFGRLLRLGHGDRVAMIFAGAQKSVAVGAPLATVLFPPAVAGTVMMPLLVFHLAQLVVAAPVAGWLRRSAPIPIEGGASITSADRSAPPPETSAP
jgi:solute carrier family 10 (sodium/bile acid cotransporter), member 7